MVNNYMVNKVFICQRGFSSLYVKRVSLYIVCYAFEWNFERSRTTLFFAPVCSVIVKEGSYLPQRMAFYQKNAPTYIQMSHLQSASNPTDARPTSAQETGR